MGRTTSHTTAVRVSYVPIMPRSQSLLEDHAKQKEAREKREAEKRDKDEKR